MKYKILSIIVVCLMLLTTFFAVAENIDAIEDKKIKQENLPLIFDDDVPVWEIGDSWTYVIDNVEFAIDDENLSEDFIIIFNMQIGEFTIEVIDDAGDLYTAEILETSVTGNYELYTDLGDGPIEAIGDFGKCQSERGPTSRRHPRSSSRFTPAPPHTSTSTGPRPRRYSHRS